LHQIEIDNFRCFKKTGRVPIAPLTLLVGENSTGKSSFLAAVRLAWESTFGEKQPDFNEEPFQLGSYDQVAHFRGGKAGRAKSFSLTISRHVPNRPELRVSTTFERRGAQPVVASQRLVSGDVDISASSSPEVDEPQRVSVTVGGQEIPQATERHGPIRWPSVGLLEWEYLLINLAFGGILGLERSSPQVETLRGLRLAFSEWRSSYGGRPFAAAPVRMKPQRTYDPVSDAPSPEGSHIPIVMDQVFFRDKEEWKRLKQFLDSYGKPAGMFDSISIRSLGKTESDPFQVRLKIAGPPVNLIDVGYGVSQVLPVLVSTALKSASHLFLFQQPEVHLHPRAQAELATVFASLVRNRRMQLVIETHSDYLVDRLRSSVREGKLDPNDVLILYFERRRSIDVRIHSIRLDSAGNLEGAPSGYRKFFLDEEQRLLGI
jgi:hypothetical protein